MALVNMTNSWILCGCVYTFRRNPYCFARKYVEKWIVYTFTPTPRAKILKFPDFIFRFSHLFLPVFVESWLIQAWCSTSFAWINYLRNALNSITSSNNVNTNPFNFLTFWHGIKSKLALGIHIDKWGWSAVN